jgi:MFS family permease
MCLFNAFSGPCSYSLITDWIHPSERTMFYSLYALGVQFGGPASLFNTLIIEWLGWRAAFQFLGLIGFVFLALAILSFDEPDRGRFDISASVVVHHKSFGSMEGSAQN